MVGYSLHIGINTVNNQAYKPLKIPDLIACENDAKTMQLIAKGYLSTILLSEKATYSNVVKQIELAASKSKAGDIFLLTYSGHGSQVIDLNKDETDGLDETWVLYDKQIIDDELYVLWSKFAAGVRIVVISDSCHSGSVVRTVGASVETVINRINKGLADKNIPKCVASGILISSSQDNQVSYDGEVNGAFTAALLKTWNDGKFKGTYRQFRDAIAKQLPRIQSPNYFIFGQSNLKFSRQTPFTI